ncbi:MAG TPA: SDR family oxidoreductase [Hyphomicrobiaceae bacterium]|nr:SDR family oxidoreductase [Hyphomicrobiaceae bacterium]
MRVLCTGGAGFLGAWLAKRLLATGHAVRIFDRSSDRRLVSDIVGAPSAAVEWRTGDVVQPAEVMAASEGCDAIAHLAALLTPACQADPITGTNVNLIGTINVFEAARHRKLRNVVYASSAGVFGPSDGVVPFPMTLYGVYKLACEGVGRAYAADYGVASVGFRPLTVYGPGREFGASAGPSIACRKAAEGEPYVIPFTGDTDMIFVDDVAAAFEAALLRPVSGARVFNLRGTVTSIDHVVAEIRRLVSSAKIAADGQVPPIAAELEPHDVEAVLGPLPKTELVDGLRQTIAFYRRQSASRAKA